MTDLVVLALGAFGLAYIVGHSKISLPVRLMIEPKDGAFAAGLREWLLLLLECPACLGFWIGTGYGYLRLAPVLHSRSQFESAVVLGCFTCSTGYALGKWTGLIIEEGGDNATDERDTASAD